MNVAYTDFIEKIMSVINKIAPTKKIRTKYNTEDLFDGEVIENIVTRDKLFKKYQTSKLQIDKEIYNAARNKVQKLVMKKNVLSRQIK